MPPGRHKAIYIYTKLLNGHAQLPNVLHLPKGPRSCNSIQHYTTSLRLCTTMQVPSRRLRPKLDLGRARRRRTPAIISIRWAKWVQRTKEKAGYKNFQPRVLVVLQLLRAWYPLFRCSSTTVCMQVYTYKVVCHVLNLEDKIDKKFLNLLIST